MLQKVKHMFRVWSSRDQVPVDFSHFVQERFWNKDNDEDAVYNVLRPRGDTMAGDAADWCEMNKIKSVISGVKVMWLRASVGRFMATLPSAEASRKWFLAVFRAEPQLLIISCTKPHFTATLFDSETPSRFVFIQQGNHRFIETFRFVFISHKTGPDQVSPSPVNIVSCWFHSDLCVCVWLKPI